MTKTELIYVVIRLCGAVCLALAVWFSLNLVYNSLTVIFMPRVPMDTGSVIAPVVIDLVLRITVLALVGLYLLRNGRLLFNLLDR